MISGQQKQTILAMRQQGHTCPEIASALILSPNTVKSICYRSGIGVQQSETTDPNVCRNCGNPLTQREGAKKRSFCNEKCRYAWWNRQRSKRPYRLVCYQCGKEFISYGNKKRRFCSRECYNRSRYEEGPP